MSISAEDAVAQIRESRQSALLLKEPVEDEIIPEETEISEEVIDGEDGEPIQEPSIELKEEADKTEALQDGQDDKQGPFSIHDLATSMEVDTSWVHENMSVQVKVDGQEETVPLKDVVESYQRNGALSRKDNDLSQTRREMEANFQAATLSIQQQEQTLASQIANAESVVGLMSQQLDAEISQLDRAKEDLEPGEYSDRLTAITQRRQAIQTEIGKLTTGRDEAQRQRIQEFTNRQAQWKQAQYQKLLESVPEWLDDDKRNEDNQKISEALINTGFTPAEINQLSTVGIDYRLTLLARKAMLYDEGQSKVKEMKKDVPKVPKVIKSVPGANRSASETKLRSAQTNFTKSKSVGDAVAFMRAKREA